MEPSQLYFVLMFVSVPLMGVLGWVIAQLLGSRSSKPGRTASSWLAMWFVFDLWNQTAGRVSGFHPQGRLVWAAFALWVVAVILMIALLTKTTLRELLWGTPYREPRIISLGLERPERPSR